MSSVPTDHVTAARPPAPAVLLPRLGLHEAAVAENDAELEVGFRFAAVQVGYWLGWASIVVVLAGLALDGGARHRWLLVGATLAAAAGNTVAMLIPWREWLATRRGRLLLDVWCGGLIAFVALLVTSARLELHAASLSRGAVHRCRADRLASRLLARRKRRHLRGRCGAGPALGRRDGDAARRWSRPRSRSRSCSRERSACEAAAHRRAAARAELERTLAQEANHRIKNDLQTAADLLLLGRPDGADGAGIRRDGGADPLDRDRSPPADRERRPRRRRGALAQHHRGRAGAGRGSRRSRSRSTRRRRRSSASSPTSWSRTRFATAHRRFVVRLERGAADAAARRRRRSRDAARGQASGSSLVRRMVEQGLDGRFELRAAATGCGTCAEVVFPTRPQ